MHLLSLYFILILAVPSLGSTVDTVLADLAAVQNNLHSLNSAITVLTPYIANINLNTASQLLAIISAGTVLIAGLGKVTADITASLPLSQCVVDDIHALNPSPVNDTDGRTVIDRIKGLEPSVVDSTAKLIQRKGVVGVLPAIPLVGNPLAIARATIVSVQAALNSAGDAAVKAAPCLIPLLLLPSMGP
ncbi:hypothetical protein DXG01_005974 [Tephrocybe rancida]|nr:hypothetical protein DXG01_005974 [Tephrocybe rancida]